MATVELYVDSIEIDVVCDSCGRGVDAQVYRGEIVVGMCEHCLENIIEEKTND